jgi:hypothetical protein
MKNFIAVLILGKGQGYFKTFRTAEEFPTSLLTVDYNIARWRNDPEVERDHKVFLGNLATKSPWLKDRPLSDLETSTRLQALVDGREGLGLGAAYSMDGIAISLQSDIRWRVSDVLVHIVELAANGDLVESPQTVRNVSEEDHWGHYRPWIESQVFRNFGNGVEVIRQAAEIMPHLDFCGKSIQQLTRMTGRERHFGWVVQSLVEANTVCSNWKEGAFPHELLPGPATGESDSVLNNHDLRNMRMFRRPNGEYDLFESHMKNHPENQRIHYLVDNTSRRVLIGYIGDHLPI